MVSGWIRVEASLVGSVVIAEATWTKDLPTDSRGRLVFPSFGIRGGTMKKCESIVCPTKAPRCTSWRQVLMYGCVTNCAKQLKRELDKEIEAHTESLAECR